MNKLLTVTVNNLFIVIQYNFNPLDCVPDMSF